MIEIHRDDDCICHLEDGGKNGWFFHVDMLKWSHEAFLRTLLTFEMLKQAMRENGLDSVRAFIPHNDSKFEKFAKLYGFEPLELEFIHPNTHVKNRIWELNLEEESCQ